MAGYTLDNKDIETLSTLTSEKISALRKDEGTSDDELAHLYTLRGRLIRLRTERMTERKENTQSSKKSSRKSGKRAETPLTATAAVE